MSDKIKITDIKGGHHGDKLKGCYFRPAGDKTFDFYEKKNDENKDGPVYTGIKDGSVFQFHLRDDENPWEIYVEKIDDEKAHGDWSTGLLKLKIIKSPADDEGSGTFQAQASGTGTVVPEETVSSATA